MLLGLVLFLWGQPWLEGHGEAPDDGALSIKKGPLSVEQWVYASSIAAVAIVWQLIQFTAVVGSLLNMTALAVLAGLTWYLYRRCDREQRGIECLFDCADSLKCCFLVIVAKGDP